MNREDVDRLIRLERALGIEHDRVPADEQEMRERTDVVCATVDAMHAASVARRVN